MSCRSRRGARRGRRARAGRPIGTQNDVAHGVVLLLVQLARLDERLESRPNRSALDAHVLQHGRDRSQSTSFGPTMPAFERYGLFDQLDWIVDGSSATSSCRKQKKPAPSDRASGTGWPPARARVVAEGPHERSPARRWPMTGHHPGLSPRDEEEQAEVRVVLAGDRVSSTSSNHGPGSCTTITARPGKRRRCWAVRRQEVLDPPRLDEGSR